MRTNSQQSNGFEECKKRKGTFVVKVEYCQNGAWQGNVTWAEENKSQRFRSGLELIRMMDEILEQTEIIQKSEINESFI